MKSKTCERKARRNISLSVRRELARQSNFACSICGEIPIVFHHIEEWSKRYSNAKKYLMPVCDKCHRRIHGKGGGMFSKGELYQHKENPKTPLILKDKLPLATKKSYAFFIGSNLISKGSKASFIKLRGNHDLITIDTSNGVFKLDILAATRGETRIYLIRNNEIVINAQSIWDMKYSSNALTIWRSMNGKKQIFIDLVITPEIIVIKRMNTTIDGLPFSIHKLRKPRPTQIMKLKRLVKVYEDRYIETSRIIDESPKINKVIDGIDIGEAFKKIQKDIIKTNMERALIFEHSKDFRTWDWAYYQWVLEKVLDSSCVFRRQKSLLFPLPNEIKQMNAEARRLRKKYKQYFEELEDVVVDYCGISMLGNIALGVN